MLHQVTAEMAINFLNEYDQNKGIDRAYRAGDPDYIAEIRRFLTDNEFKENDKNKPFSLLQQFQLGKILVKYSDHLNENSDHLSEKILFKIKQGYFANTFNLLVELNRFRLFSIDFFKDVLTLGIDQIPFALCGFEKLRELTPLPAVSQSLFKLCFSTVNFENSKNPHSVFLMIYHTLKEKNQFTIDALDFFLKNDEFLYLYGKQKTDIQVKIDAKVQQWENSTESENEAQAGFRISFAQIKQALAEYKTQRGWGRAIGSVVSSTIWTPENVLIKKIKDLFPDQLDDSKKQENVERDLSDIELYDLCHLIVQDIGEVGDEKLSVAQSIFKKLITDRVFNLVKILLELHHFSISHFFKILNGASDQNIKIYQIFQEWKINDGEVLIKFVRENDIFSRQMQHFLTMLENNKMLECANLVKIFDDLDLKNCFYVLATNINLSQFKKDNALSIDTFPLVLRELVAKNLFYKMNLLTDDHVQKMHNMDQDTASSFVKLIALLGGEKRVIYSLNDQIMQLILALSKDEMNACRRHIKKLIEDMSDHKQIDNTLEHFLKNDLAKKPWSTATLLAADDRFHKSKPKSKTTSDVYDPRLTQSYNF